MRALGSYINWIYIFPFFWRSILTIMTTNSWNVFQVPRFYANFLMLFYWFQRRSNLNYHLTIRKLHEFYVKSMSWSEALSLLVRCAPTPQWERLASCCRGARSESIEFRALVTVDLMCAVTASSQAFSWRCHSAWLKSIKATVSVTRHSALACRKRWRATEFSLRANALTRRSKF